MATIDAAMMDAGAEKGLLVVNHCRCLVGRAQAVALIAALHDHPLFEPAELVDHRAALFSEAL